MIASKIYNAAMIATIMTFVLVCSPSLSAQIESEIDSMRVMPSRPPQPSAGLESGHFLYVTAGLGSVLSDISVEWKYGNPKSGIDLQFSYGWMSKKRIGVGLMYSLYHKKGSMLHSEGMVDIHYSSWRQLIYVHYLAPQFIGCFGPKFSRWSFNYSAGFGAVFYHDLTKLPNHSGGFEGNSTNGLGWNVSIGAQFAASRHFSLIANITYTDAIIDQDFGTSYYGISFSSIRRLSYDVGVKYRF